MTQFEQLRESHAGSSAYALSLSDEAEGFHLPHQITSTSPELLMFRHYPFPLLVLAVPRS